MKRQYIAVGVLALALACLAACGKKEEAEPLETSTPVEVQTVALGSISSENKLSGTVVSGKSEQVYVAVSARCSEVYVKQGDVVKAGQAICQLDLKSFHDNYALAETNYNNAKKSYSDQAKLLDDQVAQQEKNYNNMLALLEIGSASQLEVDGAKLQLESAKVSRTSSLAQLDLAIKNAKNSMDQISDTLKNAGGSGQVVAPFAGTVVSLSVGKDGYVSAGMPVATIESTNDIKISLSVSEGLIPKLKVGDKAQVNMAALGQSFESTISQISKTVNPTNRLYTVDLNVPGGVEGILSGMFADVSLFTDSRENTVVIPTEALLVKEDGQFVVLLDGGNVAQRVQVETGLVGDGVTEITSGLSGGETLVTVGQSYLKDGDVARVVSPEE